MMSNVFTLLTFLFLCVALSAVVVLLIQRRQPPLATPAPPPQVAPLPPSAYLPQSPPPPEPSPPTREARGARDRVQERGVEALEQIAEQLEAHGVALEKIAKHVAALDARARAAAPPVPEAAKRKTAAIESFSPPALQVENPPVPGQRTTFPPDLAKTDRAIPIFSSNERRDAR